MEYTSVFSAEYLSELLNLPEVDAAKARLRSDSHQVQFRIPVTDTLRSALIPMGLEISATEIPMRWIKGDTPAHIDIGPSEFKNTYLAYLTDSPGELILGDTSYPIEANTAFSFNEGIRHETKGTGTVPRLLLGPMNESAEPVGGGGIITYYASYNNAINGISPLGYGGYAIGVGVFGNTTDYSTWGSSWRIIAYISGTLSGFPPGTYSTGFDVTTLGADSYALYPATPCFLEGTKVLCQMDGVDTYLPIETLKCGTLVKTPEGYKKVELIGKGTIFNRGDNERVQDRLYKCPVANYAQLSEDLYITGCHSILVPKISDTERRKTEEILKNIFITGNKYRLMACIDERAEPWASEGTYTIWHLALENKDVKKNYGIYVNGGLLVETCCIQRMKSKSNLTLC